MGKNIRLLGMCGDLKRSEKKLAVANADNERLRAALLLCRNYADKAMAIDPNDPLAITVEGIAEGRMGPLSTEDGGDDE